MANLRRPKLSVAETRQEIPRSVKECVDAINALKGDVTEIQTSLVTGAPPTGDAGGDLDGTYPNPEVAAIHETSGPTKLTVGAIDDGEFLKRVGSTIVSDSLATAITPVSLRGFRSEDQGGAFVAASSRVHPWGLSALSTGAVFFTSATVNTLQSVGAGQMAYAYPDCFEHAVTIERLLTRTNGTVGTGGTPRFKLGIYADSVLTSGAFTGSRYPGALLASSGDLNPGAGANAILHTNALALAVAAGTRLWGVWVCNDQAVTNQYTVPVMRHGNLLPVLGFTLDPTSPTTIAQDEATGGVGWRHAITYGTTDALPDPFPQSAPAMLTGGGGLIIPALFFGQIIT